MEQLEQCRQEQEDDLKAIRQKVDLSESRVFSEQQRTKGDGAFGLIIFLVVLLAGIGVIAASFLLGKSYLLPGGIIAIGFAALLYWLGNLTK